MVHEPTQWVGHMHKADRCGAQMHSIVWGMTSSSMQETQAVESTTVGGGGGGRAGLPLEPLGLEPGTCVGRYIALERLGAGAMGVVWSAFDPELDRKVAIKILHLRRSERGEEDRARLQREAQSLARLSHPNVVTVFDVGSFGEQLFVAMEQVDGMTLGDWVEAQKPDKDRIVRALVAAGRGLAAAHAAGLVHRDFKPDNVMVDTRERVRVMDFGLARECDGRITALRGDAKLEELLGSATLQGSPSAQELTRAGALVGTPAYMAPEQFEGANADARSDQFAFCVSAWEALTGTRPFTGESVAALVFAATEGTVSIPPAGSMTTNFRRALQRGLNADPKERWADMEALLTALLDRPELRRRWWIGLGAVSLIAGLAMAGNEWARERDAGICLDPSVQLQGSWGDEQHDKVRAGLTTSTSPLAEETSARLSSALDEWAQRWTTVAAPACMRTPELPAALLAAQGRCLANQRRELEAFVAVMHKPDEEAVRKALTAASELPAPERCADALALAQEIAAPPASTAAEVERLRDALATARAQRRSGDFASAESLIDGTFNAIEETDYRPLLAEALLEQGLLLEKRHQTLEAGEIFVKASEVALAVGANSLGAEAMLLAAGTYADRSEHAQEAKFALRVGTALSEREGEDQRLLLRRMHVQAVVPYRLGDSKSALSGFEAELAMRRTLDPSGPALGTALMGYAVALRGVGDIEAGAVAAAEAAELFSVAYPAGHPSIARAVDLEGAFAHSSGDYERATSLWTQAVEIYAAALGPDHPDTLSSMNNLAGVRMSVNDDAEAERLYRLVVDARRRVLEPGDADIGLAMCNLAAVLQRGPETPETLALFKEGVAITEAALGADHPRLAWLTLNYSSSLASAGDLEGAAMWAQRSLSAREKALGPDHPHLAMSVMSYAETAAKQGKDDVAEKHFRRAIDIWTRSVGPEHPWTVNGMSTFGLFLVDRDRGDEAKPLLEQARLALREQPGQQETVGSIDAALAQLGGNDEPLRP